MELRSELTPPLLDCQRVKELAGLINSIEDCVEIGNDPSELVALFNRGVGQNFKAYELCQIWSFMEVEEFVRSLLRTSQARKIPDITCEELLELMERVIDFKGTESEIDFYTSLLEANLPIEDLHANVFSHSDRELSPQEYLDRALTYTGKPPIITPPPSQFVPEESDFNIL